MTSLPFRAALVAASVLAVPAVAQAPAASGLIVDISLSPRAAAELRRLNEGIVVATYYSGEPTAAHEDDADESGLGLGDVEQVVPGRAGTVTVPDSVLMRDRLSWITGAPRVLVNIYSARRSGPDNLLNCETIEGTVAELGGTMQSVQCRLIGE